MDHLQVLHDLLRDTSNGPLFYFETKVNSVGPIKQERAIGADVWSLLLMSATVPDHVSQRFERWQSNMQGSDGIAFVEVAAWRGEIEFSSDEIATAWAYCLARELGHDDLAGGLRAYLAPHPMSSVDVDLYFSGLVLLGDRLEPGSFRRLVGGSQA